MYQAKLKYC